MKSHAVASLVVLITILFLAANAAAAPPDAAGEYFKHFATLSKLSVAVAQAMPPEKYSFRPHPDSMNFGELISHIAKTNYQFCAGLKDSAPPAFPSAMDKGGIVKFLSDSFEYCSAVIPSLSNEQMDQTRRTSPRAGTSACHVHSRGASSRPGGNLSPRQRHQASFLHDLKKLTFHVDYAEVILPFVRSLCSWQQFCEAVQKVRFWLTVSMPEELSSG